MKIETIDGSKEQRVLTSLITDNRVLARLATKWNSTLPSQGPLLSGWSNRIGSWCVRHFNKYGEAPQASIRNYFHRWIEKGKASESEQSVVEGFLSNLSQQWEQYGGTEQEINSDLLVDQAIEHINAVALRRLKDNIEADLESGKVDEGWDRVACAMKEELAEEEREDLLLDEEEVKSTFDGPDDVLLKFSGGLGEFFQDYLQRGRFYAFQGPEKSSKSFNLMEIAYQALLQRKRVAFFEVGDMTRRQIKKRLMTRIAEHPSRSWNGVWPYTLRVPCSITKPKRGEQTATVKYRDVTFDKPLDSKLAWDGCVKLMKKLKTKRSYFKLCVYPNSSVNVAGLRAKLRAWEIAGWVPDVILIDYADILANPFGYEEREAINQTWKELKRLNQELHCLLITATQADADAYMKDVQDRRNFSEDKRKNSHVDGMIGINVTAKDKENDVIRLNWIEGREIEISPRRCCYLASCLPLANPWALSIF